MAHLDVVVSLLPSAASRPQFKFFALEPAVFLVIFLAVAAGAFAQSPILAAEGNQPYDSLYSEIALDTLNVHLDIPIVNKQGASLPFSFGLHFNNNFYSISSSNQWFPQGIIYGNSAFGWMIGPEQVFGAVVAYSYSCSGDSGATAYVLEGYEDPSGNFQAFGPDYQYIVSSVSSCAPTSVSGQLVPGSNLTFNFSVNSSQNLVASVTTFGGVTLTPALLLNTTNFSPTPGGPMADTNGNKITLSSTVNPGQQTYIDIFGVQELEHTGQGYCQFMNWSLQTSGDISTTYTYPTSTGTANVVVTCKQYTIQTNFGCKGIFEFPGNTQPQYNNTAYLPDTIALPDNSTYKLTYESQLANTVTGRLASVTYPSGAVYSYTYTNGNGNTCIDGLPGTLQRTTPDGTWNFTRLGVSFEFNSTTTVVGPQLAGNTTTYTFYKGILIEKQVFQGNGTTALSTDLYCYDGNQTNCTTPSSISTPITEMDDYATIGTMSTSSRIKTMYDSYNNVTSKAFYDFGAAAPTTQAFTSYGQSWNGTSCNAFPSGTYIYNTPCYSHTENSAGTDLAKTQITYSNTAHPTTIAKWISGASWLTSTATYNTNGTVATATDVNGSLSTYAYNGTAGCNSLLLTSVTVTGTSLPSGGLTNSTEWNCNGAVVVQATDPNQQPTQYAYNDPFWRVTSTTDPLGNVTTYSYPTQTTSESVMNFNGSTSTSDKLVTTDGLGRQIFAQTRQGQGKSTFDTVQALYAWAATGRSITTSVPYSGTAGQSAPSGTGVTTAQYDALGRPLSVTDTGGGSMSYQYVNQDMVVTAGPAPANENPKVRQFEFNGLGWLASVCEVTAGTTSYPGKSCSPQVNTETGYLIEYSYNALALLQTVTQSANGNYAQGRSYTYDGLGRLTQEENPESGTVTYTYDSVASGNCKGSYPGDLVMKVDNAGNVICAQYDALHRITASAYPAGPYSGVTPPKTFIYDTTSETCSDPTGSNVIGRLAEAYTGTSGAKKVDTRYCYSPRGQITDVYQSTPNSGGYAHLVMTYWANGQTDSIHGISALSNLYYPLDGEGRISGLDPTALTPDPVRTVSYNPASQITNINFASGEIDAYSYDVMNRMNKYTYTLGSSSLVGSPTWNPNGTLGTLNISDQFNSANTQNCTYTYDDLARIGNVGCTGSGWGQTFTYDPFGNITKTGSSSWVPGYYNSNGSTSNQYTLGGTSYDGNGNLLKDTFNTYTWDADGNIATVNGATTNTYDAFDQLVETSVGPTQFLYLPGGTQPFATMSKYNSYLKVFVPAPGGAMIITPNGSYGAIAYHRHTDWLGSSRLATTPSETVYFDGAYAPFGEPYATSGTTDLVFGGNAEDASAVEGATAGDAYDTLNRKYSASQSRWISPDPAGLSAVDPGNPQSWNRYAYALNNPLKYIDPTGLYCDYSDHEDPESGLDPSQFDYNSTSDECSEHGGQWVDDAYTQNGADMAGRPQNAVGSNVTGQQGTLWQLLTTAVPIYVPNDVPLSPSGQAAALAIHNSLSLLPNICSVGINLSVGGNRVSVGADLNSGKGLNPMGQVSTPVGPYVSARYNIGNNGEVPTVSGVSLRVGPPTGFAGTVGVTSSGTITSVGANGQVTFPGIGKAGVTAYVGLGNAYSCP
jgi:RHS repeat-associated protein